MSDNALSKEFQSYPVKPRQHRYQVGQRTMNYAEIGDDSLPVILFIHGSPGSWMAFKGFFKDSILIAKAKLVSVDRPGFGYSNYGKAEPSLSKQAACILPLLQQYGSRRPVILVGHSLGGPLIARLTMDYPQYIKGLIFLAASVDPELEPQEWFRKPMNAMRWILPGSIRASNKEIMSLKSELQLMLPLWSGIHQSCIVIQGDADNLVPPDNAIFLKKHLVNASVEVVMLKDMNHFIPWKRPQVVHQAILQMIDKN